MTSGGNGTAGAAGAGGTAKGKGKKGGGAGVGAAAGKPVAATALAAASASSTSDAAVGAALTDIMSCFILRRTKDTVNLALPPKTRRTQWTPLTSLQRSLADTLHCVTLALASAGSGLAQAVREAVQNEEHRGEAALVETSDGAGAGSSGDVAMAEASAATTSAATGGKDAVVTSEKAGSAVPSPLQPPQTPAAPICAGSVEAPSTVIAEAAYGSCSSSSDGSSGNGGSEANAGFASARHAILTAGDVPAAAAAGTAAAASAPSVTTLPSTASDITTVSSANCSIGPVFIGELSRVFTDSGASTVGP